MAQFFPHKPQLAPNIERLSRILSDALSAEALIVPGFPSPGSVSVLKTQFAPAILTDAEDPAAIEQLKTSLRERGIRRIKLFHLNSETLSKIQTSPKAADKLEATLFNAKNTAPLEAITGFLAMAEEALKSSGSLAKNHGANLTEVTKTRDGITAQVGTFEPSLKGVPNLAFGRALGLAENLARRAMPETCEVHFLNRPLRYDQVVSPSYFLAPVAVAASEYTAAMLVRSQNKRGFFIHLKKDESALVGYRVASIYSSSPMLFYLTFVQVLRQFAAQKDPDFYRFYESFERWLQRHKIR